MPTGNKIKEFRIKKGLTRKELGNLCGMADSAIRRYENGKANPKMETLQKIATALRCNISELLSDEDNSLYIDYAMDVLAKQAHTKKVIEDYVTAATYEDENELSNLGLLEQRTTYYNLYNKLNAIGKKEAIKRVEELTEIDKYKETLENMEEIRKNRKPKDLKFPDQDKK